MKYIPLQSKQHTKQAIVDDEDYPRLIKMKWYFNASPPGYAVYSFKEAGVFKQQSMHRLIMGFPKELVIDHINGNPLDNRKTNLRLCTRAENMQNMKKPKNGKLSRYKGVSKDYSKWTAYISVGGKTKALGRFDTEVEAAIAYNEAAVLHRGQFARLNKIEATTV